MQALIFVAMFAFAAAAAPQPQKPQQVVFEGPKQFRVVPQVAQQVYARPQLVKVAIQPQVQTKVYNGVQTIAAPLPVQQTVVAAPVAASIAASAPANQRQVPVFAILRSNLDDNFDGNFQYDFETENGITVNSAGSLKQISPKEVAQVIQGSYSYTAPDGRLITTSYVADENGFQVQGDHLPVAPQEPELPPLIAKSLAYIRSLPPQPENQQ